MTGDVPADFLYGIDIIRGVSVFTDLKSVAVKRQELLESPVSQSAQQELVSQRMGLIMQQLYGW